VYITVCFYCRMESKVFTCVVCGVSRSSKFALKRHQRHEHPPAAIPATHPAEVVVVPTATASQQRVEDTRVVTMAATR